MTKCRVRYEVKLDGETPPLHLNLSQLTNNQ